MALIIGTSYDVTPYAQTILGGLHKASKLVAIVDSTIAVKFREVIGIHQQIYSQLPPGTPSAVKDLQFYIFETPDGLELVLAAAWVNTAIVVATSAINIVINDGDLAKIPNIRSSLIALGFNNFTIT